MQLYELKEQLVKKQVQPAYIFTGEEIAVMDIYINEIAKVMETNPKRVDTLASIYSRLQNQSFMNKPSCYVIRDDKDYLAQDKIWEDIHSGAIQGNNVIIFVYTSIDKRSKFYKQFNKSFTEFEKLAPEVLAKYIKRDIGLDGKYAIELANLCDCNYSRVILEGDKLTHLAAANNIDITAAYLKAINENLIHTAPEDVIFQMIDAVCKRAINGSYLLLEELIAGNQNPLSIISLLYNNFRSMLLVQSAGETNNITERTGLTPWQVKLAKEKGTNYSIGELVRILRTIRETERGIKTGTIEQSIAVEYLLMKVL